MIDFSFIRMLDYPLQPKLWFRVGKPVTKIMSNRVFNKVLKEIEIDLLNGVKDMPNHRGMFFSKEQFTRIKLMTHSILLFEKNSNDYTNFIEQKIRGLVWRW